jgi:hypothetical protein
MPHPGFEDRSSGQSRGVKIECQAFTRDGGGVTICTADLVRRDFS